MIDWLVETGDIEAALPGADWVAETAAGSATQIGQIFDDVACPLAALAARLTSIEIPPMTTSYTHQRKTDTTDKVGNTTQFTDIIEETWEPDDVAAKRSLELPVPVYLTGAGVYAQDAQGSLLSLDAAGSVYRDGRKLQGVAALKLAVVGKAIYAKGKTVPTWWQWTGAGWAGPITDGDPNILN